MANLDCMYTSKTDEWATPQNYFDEINKEFNFNLDPCATKDNHKCDRYFTLEDDGLTQNWGGVEYSAIHLTVRLISGLKRLLERLEMTIRLSLC